MVDSWGGGSMWSGPPPKIIYKTIILNLKYYRVNIFFKDK